MEIIFQIDEIVEQQGHTQNIQKVAKWTVAGRVCVKGASVQEIFGIQTRQGRFSYSKNSEL